MSSFFYLWMNLKLLNSNSFKKSVSRSKFHIEFSQLCWANTKDRREVKNKNHVFTVQPITISILNVVHAPFKNEKKKIHFNVDINFFRLHLFIFEFAVEIRLLLIPGVFGLCVGLWNNI